MGGNEFAIKTVPLVWRLIGAVQLDSKRTNSGLPRFSVFHLLLSITQYCPLDRIWCCEDLPTVLANTLLRLCASSGTCCLHSRNALLGAMWNLALDVNTQRQQQLGKAWIPLLLGEQIQPPLWHDDGASFARIAMCVSSLVTNHTESLEILQRAPCNLERLEERVWKVLETSNVGDVSCAHVLEVNRRFLGTPFADRRAEVPRHHVEKIIQLFASSRWIKRRTPRNEWLATTAQEIRTLMDASFDSSLADTLLDSGLLAAGGSVHDALQRTACCKLLPRQLEARSCAVVVVHSVCNAVGGLQRMRLAENILVRLLELTSETEELDLRTRQFLVQAIAQLFEDPGVVNAFVDQLRASRSALIALIERVLRAGNAQVADTLRPLVAMLQKQVEGEGVGTLNLTAL